MSKNHDITRRALIASAGATIATAALAAPYVNAAHLSPAGDERLHQLMAEWRAAYDAANNSADHPDDLTDPLTAHLWAIEDTIAAIRPTTVEGFAIKLLVLTNFGEFDLDGRGEVVLPDAEAIAGYAPPATWRRT